MINIDKYFYENQNKTIVNSDKIKEELTAEDNSHQFHALFLFINNFECAVKQSRYKDKLPEIYGIFKRYVNVKSVKSAFEICELKRLNYLTASEEKSDVFMIKWLAECTNMQKSTTATYFSFSNRNREEEIKKVIFDENGKLKQFFNDHADAYGIKLIDWFLRRYDLKTVFKLYRQLASAKNENETKEPFPTLSSILFFICCAIAVCLNQDFLFPKLNRFDFFAISNFYIYFYYLVFLTMIVFFLFHFIKHKKSNLLSLKLIFPRLLGGIMIGYVPMILAPEIWDMVNKMEAPSAVATIVLTGLASLGFLFIEVRNITQDVTAALYRSFRLWCIGLFQSFFVGLLAQDLFAKAFVTGQNRICCFSGMNPVPGLFDSLIYPKVHLVYIPMALLIGIFMQIIWEDKPVTQPL